MSVPMDRSRRFFGSLTTFDEAFPDIANADVEYTETHGGSPLHDPGQVKYHNVKHGGLIQCSNPLCRRGGYELEMLISAMKHTRQTETEGSVFCPGDEGSPKGKRMGRRCLNHIHYELKIKYK